MGKVHGKMHEWRRYQRINRKGQKKTVQGEARGRDIGRDVSLGRRLSVGWVMPLQGQGHTRGTDLWRERQSQEQQHP